MAVRLLARMRDVADRKPNRRSDLHLLPVAVVRKHCAQEQQGLVLAAQADELAEPQGPEVEALQQGLIV